MHIIRSFSIADTFEEREVVSTFIFILYEPLITNNGVFPTLKAIVVMRLRIAESKQIVLLQADVTLKVPSLYNSLSQHKQLIG